MSMHGAPAAGTYRDRIIRHHRFLEPGYKYTSCPKAHAYGAWWEVPLNLYSRWNFLLRNFMLT